MLWCHPSWLASYNLGSGRISRPASKPIHPAGLAGELRPYISRCADADTPPIRLVGVGPVGIAFNTHSGLSGLTLSRPPRFIKLPGRVWRVTTTLGEPKQLSTKWDIVFAGQQPTKASAYKSSFPASTNPEPVPKGTGSSVLSRPCPSAPPRQPIYSMGESRESTFTGSSTRVVALLCLMADSIARSAF